MLKEASKQRLHRVETTMAGEMPPDLLALINAELARQDAKWGDQRGNGDLFWLAILGEEFGECSKEVADQEDARRKGARYQGTFNALNDEMVDAMAVLVQWYRSRNT